MSTESGSTRPPSFLFHGTSRPINGDRLLPVLPSGDVGDPPFPVVFASDCMDFAALFSLKTSAVTHISAGSFPYVIVTEGHPDESDRQGTVFVLRNEGFNASLAGGVATGKWWCTSPVPIARDQCILITGRRHLLRLGAVIIYVRPGASSDRHPACDVDAALRSPASEANWWTQLGRMVEAGNVRYESYTSGSANSGLQSLIGTSGLNDTLGADLERFLDSSVCPKLPLRIRVRLIHGIDHACRAALLCRILHNLLVIHGVIRAFAPADLAALMVAAIFHDSARCSDSGPDHSATESAAFARRIMLDLGFSNDAAQLTVGRISHEHAEGSATGDIGAAILQTADAFELMRNYVGDIWLPNTSLFRLLERGRPDVIAALIRVGERYADWIQRLQVWGLARGRVVGPNGVTLVASGGPQFDPVAVFKRNLSEEPFANTRASLRTSPDLEQLYEGKSPPALAHTGPRR